MRVLIAGCGYVGLALGSRLVAEGHHVAGLRRSQEASAAMAAAGLEPLIADFTEPSQLARLPRDWDWVIHCGGPSAASETAYRSVYLGGARQLLTWLRRQPLRAFVWTGSTSVYGQTDGSVVTEQSATVPPSVLARVLLETEDFLCAMAREGAPVRILRVAGIYGPGRNRLTALVQGKLHVSGDRRRHINFIQVEDLVSAIVAILTEGKDGEVYNVSDGSAVEEQEVLEWLSTATGVPLPGEPPPGVESRRSGPNTSKQVSSEKLQRELSWRPKHPSFREGYAPLIEAWRRSQSEALSGTAL